MVAALSQMLEQFQQPQGQSKSIPAPVGGLNAMDALANMAETDAIVLDNLFPQPSFVEIRGGKSTIATFTGVCETLAAYNSLTGSNQLFGAVNNAGVRSIFRMDGLGGGAVGAAVVGGGGATIEALTSTRFDWAQFGTGSAEVLYLLNGTDTPLIYDGTTWAAAGFTAGPSPLSSLNCVAIYKQRAWFLQKNTFNLYYLPQNNYTGAMTLLNLAPNFKLGWYLISIVTVSVDNAAGINDYIAFVSNQGEVVVFQGYDPSAVATWSLAGHFRIGRPIGVGRRCWQKLGSDAAILTTDGLILMSEALLTDRSQTLNAITKKIRRGINQAIGLYGANFGWQVQLYPDTNKLIVNVPTSEDAAGYSFVMNTLNGSWCTFGLLNSPWNAICYETMGSGLYYGTVGKVCQADAGTSDDGSGITWSVLQAFSYFDIHTLKQWTLARPVWSGSVPVMVSYKLCVDFDQLPPITAIPLSKGQQANWNTPCFWNTPTYWGDANLFTRNWVGSVGVGYCAAPYMQGTSLNATGQWQSIDHIYVPAGML